MLHVAYLVSWTCLHICNQYGTSSETFLFLISHSNERKEKPVWYNMFSNSCSTFLASSVNDIHKLIQDDGCTELTTTLAAEQLNLALVMAFGRTFQKLGNSPGFTPVWTNFKERLKVNSSRLVPSRYLWCFLDFIQ